MIRQKKILTEKKKPFLFFPSSSHNTFIYLPIERKYPTRFVSDDWSTLAGTIGSSVSGWSRGRSCEFQCLKNTTPPNAQSDESLQLQTDDVRRWSAHIKRSSFHLHRSTAAGLGRVSDECGSCTSVEEKIATNEAWSQFRSSQSLGGEGLSFRVSAGCAQSHSIEFGTDRSSEKHAQEDFRDGWPAQDKSLSRSHTRSVAIHADGKTTGISRKRHHTSKPIVLNVRCRW